MPIAFISCGSTPTLESPIGDNDHEDAVVHWRRACKRYQAQLERQFAAMPASMYFVLYWSNKPRTDMRCEVRLMYNTETREERAYAQYVELNLPTHWSA